MGDVRGRDVEIVLDSRGYERVDGSEHCTGNRRHTMMITGISLNWRGAKHSYKIGNLCLKILCVLFSIHRLHHDQSKNDDAVKAVFEVFPMQVPSFPTLCSNMTCETWPTHHC